MQIEVINTWLVAVRAVMRWVNSALGDKYVATPQSPPEIESRSIGEISLRRSSDDTTSYFCNCNTVVKDVFRISTYM